MRSDLKKLDCFSLETSNNHLIRNFLRNGRLRVKFESPSWTACAVLGAPGLKKFLEIHFLHATFFRDFSKTKYWSTCNLVLPVLSK